MINEINKVVEAVNIIREYCENRECSECNFHDLTVYHDCRLMKGMPCNWSVAIKEL